MNIKSIKNFLPLLALLLMSLSIIVFAVILYSKWTQPIDEKKIKQVEVNLPIIDWAGYTNLSKKYKFYTINGKE